MPGLVTVDSFNDSKNFKEVIQLAGVPVADADLNESRKQLWVELSEQLASGDAASRAAVNAQTSSLSFIVAEGSDWQPYANGAADILLRAGTCFVDGMRLNITADMSLAGQGLIFNPVMSNTYGLIIMQLVIQQIDGSTDPDTITEKSIGQTSIRYKLVPTFIQCESTSSFEAAILALPAVATPVSPPARIWKGDTARVILGRYVRPAATSTMLNTYLVDMRQPSGAERLSQNYAAVKAIRANNTTSIEGAGYSDGTISWTASSGVLALAADNGQSNSNAVQNGLIIRRAGAPDHYTSQYYTIPDGSALGYYSIPSFNTNAGMCAALVKKTLNDSPRQAVYDPGVTASYTPTVLQPGAKLTIEGLVVDTVDNFMSAADAGLFILCQRVGNDLCWFNGQVTRGSSLNAVMDELGTTPSPFDAVVAQLGTGNGNHATQASGFDRALTSMSVSGSLSNGRTLRLLLRRGAYTVAQGVRSFGFSDTGQTTAYGAANSTVEWIGDGDMSTKITFSNPVSSGRSVTTQLGVCQIQANKVVLRGITFSQVENSSNPAAYLLNIQATEVILEDCSFNGAVNIAASSIRISNCIFSTSQTGSYAAFGSSTNTFPYASGLYLATSQLGTAINAWKVDSCQFYIGAVQGTSAAVCVDIPTGGLSFSCHINNSNFVYYGHTAVPAIHIVSPGGSIKVTGCSFSGANGAPKSGVAADGTAAYASGNYNGSYLLGSGVQLTQQAATAYISLVGNRARNSLLLMQNNVFDCSALGNAATANYIAWGAFICSPNYITTGSTGGAIIANIVFDNNEVILCQENGVGYGTAAVPVISGFYIAPTIPDGANLTNFVLDNIQVTNNKFDLGGGGTATSIQNAAWRSYVGQETFKFVASAGYGWLIFTEATCAIGIKLKNFTFFSNTHTGRVAIGVLVSDNRIAQRPVSGSFGNASNQVALPANVPGTFSTLLGSYTFNAIVVDHSDWLHCTQCVATSGAGTGGAAPALTFSTSAPYTASGGNCVKNPVIANNQIIAEYYQATSGTGAGSDGELVVGILLTGGLSGKVTGNFITLGIQSGGGPANFFVNSTGISLAIATIQTLVASNNVSAECGVFYGVADGLNQPSGYSTNAYNQAGNNTLITCITPFVSSNYPTTYIIKTYAGAGDNF